MVLRRRRSYILSLGRYGSSGRIGGGPTLSRRLSGSNFDIGNSGGIKNVCGQSLAIP